MSAIYSNGGNRWNILGFNFTKRDALSSVYKISMAVVLVFNLCLLALCQVGPYVLLTLSSTIFKLSVAQFFQNVYL